MNFKKNDNCRKKYYTRTKNYLLKNIHEKKLDFKKFLKKHNFLKIMKKMLQ